MKRINVKKCIDMFKVYTYGESFEILKRHAKESKDKTKTLLIVAGPNGSGKSTFIANLFKIENVDLEYVNADIYAVTNFSNQENKDLLAMNFAMKRCEQLILEEKSFIYETVLSHESKINLVKQAKKNGFYIIGVFVYTDDAQINVERVHKRVHEGGHNVDEIKILTRYERSINNRKLLQDLCNEFYMFDNSKDL